MTIHNIIDDPRPWAFSRPDLIAGLRSYTGDPTLTLLQIEEQAMPGSRPSVGRIRGLRADCQTAIGMRSFYLVQKETQGPNRTGMAGIGRREAQFYQALSYQLPIRTPRLLSASPDGAWMIFELLEGGRPPEIWSAEEYRLAIDKLVALHDRFWGLGEDLAAYTWLARPLDLDLEIYVKAAHTGMRRLVEKVTSNLITRNAALIEMLQRLVQNADQIADVLRAEPATLLHGDYWPGNLRVYPDGTLYAYDWQQASIGPAVLDLFHFVQASQWYFSPLPIGVPELVAAYRAGLSKAVGHTWNDDAWDALWDYALLWSFLTSWVDMLASIPAAVLQTRYQQMKTLWLEPVDQALNRRLPKG